MYENMTYEFLLKRMLARVNQKFDKREGSIIFDGVAPAAFELAEAYIMARVILKQTFANTADREWLELRAAEYNIYPYPATYAEVEGQFSKAISLGSRFNFDKYNFIVTELISDSDHTYKLKCEQSGIAGNTCIGDITPIGNISGLETAKITKLLVPGENEEETEAFRTRYMSALKSKAYGGNGDDYKEKVLSLSGVGGVKVYRCWNGGGTVQCVIVNTQYSSPTSGMIKEVQTAIDPKPQGQGYGIAPIGHVVTIAGATETKINISGIITPAQGYTVEGLTPAITSKINEYLKNRRIEWSTQTDKQYVTVRSAFILAKVLEVANVRDANITIDGSLTKLDLAPDAIPVLGTVSLVGG